MTTETKSQFAKRINRAPSYITELISHGRIVLSENGNLVEVEQSLARLEETASHSRQGVAAFHESRRAQKKPPQAPEVKPEVTDAPKKRGRKPRGSDEVDEHSRQFYERVYQGAKNNIKQLEFDMSYGRRFAMVDVKKEGQAIGNSVRAALERLVDSLAPRLALISSKQEKKQLIEQEIKQLRRVIKGEFPRAFRRLKKG